MAVDNTKLTYMNQACQQLFLVRRQTRISVKNYVNMTDTLIVTSVNPTNHSAVLDCGLTPDFPTFDFSSHSAYTG